MRAFEFITGHVIYNLAYTYKFQLKTTNVYINEILIYLCDKIKLPCYLIIEYNNEK